MEETEEAIKKHYVDTWDEQYRSWIGKTDKKISFLRSSNENMQTFIMKNARHLPFAATDELKIYNEYGEKVSVFQWDYYIESLDIIIHKHKIAAFPWHDTYED